MTRPPAWGGWLLRVLLGPEEAEFIDGDLHEDFAERCASESVGSARRWYRRQVFGTLRSRLLAPGRVEAATRDVRYAGRGLRSTPGYTALVVGTLGVGIGGAITIGSLASSVLSPRPYPNSDALVAVWETRAGAQRSVSPANYLDWRRESTAFEGLAAHMTQTVAVTVDGAAALESAAIVSGNFFSVLGVDAVRGRTFDPDLDPAFPEREVVVNEAAAARWFGDGADPIGRPIRLDDLVHTVVGVMPSDFGFPERDIAAWTRSPTEAPELRNLPEGLSLVDMRDSWYFEVVGRVRPDRSIAVGRSDLEGVAGRLAEVYPDTNAESGVLVVPLLDQTVADFDRILIGLGIAVALILLAATANVLHLTRARSEARRTDATIRMSIGASRRGLARGYLVEAGLLGIGAAGVGLVIAQLATAVLRRHLVGVVPRAETLTVPGTMWLGAAILGLAVGAVVGRVALRVAAPRAPLRVRRFGASGGRGLVAAQVATSIAVLAGAALLARSFDALGRVDLGFEAEGLATVRISLPDAASLSYEERLGRYAEVGQAVSRLEGVEGYAFGAELPLRMGMGAGVRVYGVESFDDPPNAGWQPVEPDYFRTVGMTLLSGRPLDATDRQGTLDVAVVNEAFVRDVLVGADPLGARVTMGLDGHDRPLEIVGVVADTRTRGPAEAAGPVLYRPLAQTDRYGAGSLVLAARLDGSIERAGLVSAIRGAAPALPLSQIRTGPELVAPFRSTQAMLMYILGVFAATAVAIGLVGVYGVGMYTVRRARREIGVRLALGATAQRVTGTVLRDGLRSAAIGVPFGLLSAYLVGRAVRDLLFMVSPGDPLVLTAVVGVVVALTASAFWVPARFAARIDPATAIRDG